MKKLLGFLMLVGFACLAVWCFRESEKPEVQARDFVELREKNERLDAKSEEQKAAAEQDIAPEPVHERQAKTDENAIANLPVRQTAAGRSLSTEQLAYFVAAQNEQKAREPDASTEANLSETAAPQQAGPTTSTNRTVEFQEFITVAQQIAATKSLSDLRTENGGLTPEAQAMADKAVALASQFLTPEQAEKLQELQSNTEAMRKLGRAASRVLGSKAARNFLEQ